MIRVAIIIVCLLALVTAAGIGYAASPVAIPDNSDATPAQTIKALRKQLSAARAKIADKQDEIDAQDDLISTQIDTIARLRARDPLDAVTARGPDGLWDAMVAIWQQFPTLPLGEFCGYDKSSVPGGGVGLTATSYSFYRWSGC